MKGKKVKETKTEKRITTERKSITERKITNSQPSDSSGKVIYDEPILCAQFVRDYVDLPYMKDVQPEDIEDVSSQYVPLIAEERNADRVKKIKVKGKNPFFLISLIEHKTKTEYNIFMQIFRYMVYIWEDYEKQEEKKRKGIGHLVICLRNMCRIFSIIWCQFGTIQMRSFWRGLTKYHW